MLGNVTVGSLEIMLRYCIVWLRGLGLRDSRGYVKLFVFVYVNKLIRWLEIISVGGVVGVLLACFGRVDFVVSFAFLVLCFTYYFMSLGLREVEGFRW